MFNNVALSTGAQTFGAVTSPVKNDNAEQKKTLFEKTAQTETAGSLAQTETAGSIAQVETAGSIAFSGSSPAVSSDSGSSGGCSGGSSSGGSFSAVA
ncbi:hypothetical protein tpqmel_0233 [Candidatus Gastranaerophilus sp. (ex Termes propinquus)]|nr:hypothetical protein tpqmel_0233 [Candidatus Gastranaerophilus sp. (ex Termes propinquus)]